MAKAAKAKARGKSKGKKKSRKAKAGKAKVLKKKLLKKSAARKKPPAKKVRKAVKKKKAPLQKPRRGAPVTEANFRMEAGAAPLALKLTKSQAVITCVNAFMNEHRGGWNDDLQGDERKLVDDFQESPPIFLDEVNTCLEGKGFTIFPVPNALLDISETGKIREIKFAMIKAAKPKP